MNGHAGTKVGAAHFHLRDQFQLVVHGEFKLGRHALSPYCIHFARAYTPYGPLIPDARNGGDYTFIVMRAHRDAGAQYVATEREQLRAMPNRQPWQVSSRVKLPESRASFGDVTLQVVPDMKDEQGLAAYTLIMKPGAKTVTPDPAHSDGQYIVVVKGGLVHEGKEHQSHALVFVRPEEGPYRLHAGAQGLEAIVLNFPMVVQRTAQPVSPAMKARARGLRKWQCELCAFAYEEALGMPEDGIAPGTRWEDVPEDWSCPDCAAGKADFRMVEIVEA
jgi:rubredoxin